MIVAETTCREVIKSIVSSCYDEITNDNDPTLEALIPILKDRKYLAGVVNGEIIGLVVYCFKRERTMIHIMVKPEFRARYAGILARKALQDRKGTIYTEIPDLYPNVIKFAERLGFKIIDRSKTCFKRGTEHVVNTLRLD